MIFILLALVCQINIVDQGAIPGDGVDDSPAIERAIKLALASEQSVYVPEGVFESASLSFWQRENTTLVIRGESHNSVIRRHANKSWTQRCRIKDRCVLRFENLQLDGNNRNLPATPGDDQHHEIRIDGTGEPALVEFEDIWLRDMQADGIQFVHNGLQIARLTRVSFIGGSTGRRNIQFSYHPKTAIVSDCVLDDLSTEPAGGTQNRVNLLVSNCIIQGQANLQECGDLRVANTRIGHLSQLTCDSGSMTGCDVQSVRRFAVGPSNITVRDSRWRLTDTMKVWSRFPRMKQSILFDNVQFESPENLPVFFEAIGDAKANAKIEFKNCDIPPGSWRIGTGYDVKILGPVEVVRGEEL